MASATATTSPRPALADGAAPDHGLTLRWLVTHRARIMAAIALVALVTGGALHLADQGSAGDRVWQVAVALLAAELAAEVAHTVLVDRHMGVDTIALVAMIGALALGEELAGVVVGLMFSGGAALEDAASTPRAHSARLACAEAGPASRRRRVRGGAD
jgi:hypothetical protein